MSLLDIRCGQNMRYDTLIVVNTTVLFSEM